MKRALYIGAALVSGIAFAQEEPAFHKTIEIHGTEQASEDVVFSVPALPVTLAAPTMEFIGSEMIGPPRTMKNSPYSAETTTESVQVLADGNKITNKSTSQFYRDSEGRTRREMTVNAPGGSGEPHKFITIEDPVAGVHYMLNTEKKTATKIPLPKFNGGEAGIAMASGVAGRLSVAGAPPSAGTAMAAPMIAYNHVRAIKRNDGNESVNMESLGTQVMEGLNVKGTRTSFTIPAGQMGNERPITSTTEVWFSEDLGTTISSKRSDPRFGDTTSKTTNIQRSEPARYLFDVPSEYKVVDASSADTITFDKKIVKE